MQPNRGPACWRAQEKRVGRAQKIEPCAKHHQNINKTSSTKHHKAACFAEERKDAPEFTPFYIRQFTTQEPARHESASFSVRGLRGNTGEEKMTYQDINQQSSWQNPMQWGGTSHTPGMNFGLGQAAYGLQSGPYGTGQFGGAWGQRQLSPQDVGEVVRQMVPLLPQILAQSQQPLAAFGYGASQRQLSPQDINEVVRQLLPILPQIVGAIQQGQSPMHMAAIQGGFGQQGFGQSFGWQNPQNPYGQQGQYGLGFGQSGPQGQFGQFGSPFQAAFGGSQNWGQRQLSQQDVNDVTRQLVSVIPQIIGNLQAYGQRLN
jgi:hypothetical protein